jgi:Ca-activated chloride channel family protein
VRGAALGATDGRGFMETGMRVIPEPRSAARRIVPRVPQFDLAFEMAYGESPFITPATLATDRPPLTMGTDSFDALCGWAGRRPPAEVVAGLRTEEILAALPAPAGDTAPGPALAIHAVRSLRGRPETCLMEVRVTAGPLPRPTGAAIDSVLALDRYAGSEPLLWQRICRALKDVANLMRPDDRLTVVVGGRRPRLAGDRLDAAGVRRLAETLAAEPAAATAEFDATMRAAIRERERLGGRPLVVLASVEAVERASDEGRVAVAAWRESLVTSSGRVQPAEATRFVIVDPAQRAVRGVTNPEFWPTAADGRQVARDLVERVFGVAGLTARQCRLEVSFDPKVVATYRLVGHRQSAMESLASGPAPAIDLHAGETVRVVYEVIPKAADGRAVTAKLSFRPTGVAADRVATATLSLKAVESDALPSPHGCELVLAVALGDIASGSPHAGPRGAAIQAVADLAAAWRSRGDVGPGGAMLLDACDRLGFTPTSKSATAARPSGGDDRTRARLTD